MNCPECKKAIGMLEKSCPYCGYPICLSIFERIGLQWKVNTKEQNIAISVGILAIIATISIIGNAIILSTRMTFDSEDEMQLYLIGTWSNVDDYTKKIVITGDRVTKYYKYAGLKTTGRIEYYPQRGYVEYAGTKYTVKEQSDGNMRLVTLGESYEYDSASTSEPY